MKEVNKSLYDILRALPDQPFASVCYFTADVSARVGTYVIAGHPAPYQMQPSIGRIARVPKVKPPSAAIGVIADEEFSAGNVQLSDGDTFLFLTNGAYEAADKNGEQYGLARLEKFLQAHIHEGPESLLSLILEDITKFAGDEPLGDDICLVTLHMTSKPPAST